MSFPKDDDELDAALSEAFTPPPAADFAAWQRQHSEAVACLNPQQMRQILRSETRTQRQTIWRTIMTHRYAAACVASIACVAAIAGATIVAGRMSGDADRVLSLQPPNPPAVTPGPSASGEIVALKPKPAEAHLKAIRLLSEKSVAERVAEAEVIVVATFVDSAPAKPKHPRDMAETSMRFRVVRILKGQLHKKIITTQSPSQLVSTGINELAGKEWILMLTPEFMAGKHPYADLNTIKIEPEVRSILAAKRGDP